MTVGDQTDSVRSKNAGPFWVTIDIFCGNSRAFQLVKDNLRDEQVADALQQPLRALKRFNIPSLNVVKFSVHRPIVQGHHSDRDMHGAQWAELIKELTLDQ